MAMIHIWGNGPYHPLQAQADWIASAVAPQGHRVLYGNKRAIFDSASLAQADLLILSGIEWSGMAMAGPGDWENPALRTEHYEPLSEAHFQSILAHLEAGKPLLCHHAAITSFDERPEFEEIFDGRWVWDRSTHGPIHEFEVRLVDAQHPINAGLSTFRITDELYYKLNYPKRSTILLEADYEGQTWPLAWAGKRGQAKVTFSGLGHDMRAYSCPSLQKFLLNMIEWLLENE